MSSLDLCTSSTIERYLGSPAGPIIWPARPIYHSGWLKTPLLSLDPAMVFTYWQREEEKGVMPRLPVVKVPIPLGFDPAQAMKIDDAKQHDGVSFRALWRDQVARVIWLGHKPFMLTSQYFRAGCMDQAARLRRWPNILLGERINLNPEERWVSDYSFYLAIGAQLAPYLMWALRKQGHWPFWLPGNARLLTASIRLDGGQEE